MLETGCSLLVASHCVLDPKSCILCLFLLILFIAVKRSLFTSIYNKQLKISCFIFVGLVCDLHLLILSKYYFIIFRIDIWDQVLGL